MKTKKNIILILMGIAFILNISIASADILILDNPSFSGNNIFSDTAGGYGGYCCSASYSGGINNLNVNFNAGKEIKTIITGYSPYVAHYTGSVAQTLSSQANGLNELFTTFTADVSGQYYGEGIIGWKRSTGNEFRYEIIFTSRDDSYANTLSGTLSVSLTYNTSVFSGYFVANINSVGTDGGTSSYVSLYSGFYSTSYSRFEGGKISTIVYINYEFQDSPIISFTNTSSIYGFVNLTKYNVNYRLNITNLTGYSFYDITSITDVSYFIVFSDGINLRLQHIGLDIWSNYSYSITQPTSTIVSGNITVDKTNYNFGETILYNYTLSNAPTGITDNRIQIFRYDESFKKIPVFINSNVQNGVFNKSYYVSDDFLSWRYYISLESWSNTLGWVELDYKMFNITSITPSINFDFPYYESGRTMTIYYTSNESGYTKLINPDGITKLNYSHTGSITQSYSYYLNQDDASGNWTVNLYSSSGVIYASDYAINNEAIIIEPTPIITPSVTEPENFLDIGTQISEIMIGKMTDDSGIVTDVKIQETGNKMFGLLLTLVFLCLIAGTYYTLTNKKR